MNEFNHLLLEMPIELPQTSPVVKHTINDLLSKIHSLDSSISTNWPKSKDIANELYLLEKEDKLLSKLKFSYTTDNINNINNNNNNMETNMDLELLILPPQTEDLVDEKELQAQSFIEIENKMNNISTKTQ